MKLAIAVSALLLICTACTRTNSPSGPPTVDEARTFMQQANTDLLALSNEAQRAAWVQETYITDDTEAIAAKANERLLNRTNELVIAARRFKDLQLPPDLARQFKLLNLNGSPTDPKLVAELTQVSSALDGMYGKGKYCPPGKSGDACLGIDQIDVLMAKSRNPKELEDLWQGWHKISPPMRDKYARLVDLSNQGAREFGYKDTGDLWRSGYDMTPEQFSAELERTWTQLEPLYRELHAYVRFKLVQKYGAAAERPDGMIPAYLLGNMWAQEWGNIYDIVAPSSTGYRMYDLETSLKKQIGPVPPLETGKKMAHYGEGFFTSLGFQPLPETFWQRSQFIKPRDRDVVCHASAWDVDNDQDLRIKMCLNVTADDFTTVHHEEGHNFYQRAYRNQPYLFRNGANDGFHEAIGDAIALSITPDYLKQLKLIDTVPPIEADIPLQLRTALDKVAFLPFGLLIDKWRWQVFSGETKPADYNKSWWALREKYQGVAPPTPRDESNFDPGAKYHIPGNVPYARYFLARIYQFQFYKAMCDASGYKGPLNRCSFYGSKAAGDKLNAMLEAGQSKPWQETLKTMTGSDHLDAGPMLEYFAPLYQWLKQQNAANHVTVGWQVK
ncbi:MAG: M2 family metallopeptidase [Edaphobacter sp.]|uniref:M2 family metallopeptidase n=1 Tax=Edaphobacter sp. TaxID=1934404 RepID=UPI00238D962D|nr:M2 family metallopeptidase [Edaphobacter sp.]MDE1175782.1 M2 family metallopeptidase [Edaphobacter sp.]